jgi:hypothetical protein
MFLNYTKFNKIYAYDKYEIMESVFIFYTHFKERVYMQIIRIKSKYAYY